MTYFLIDFSILFLWIFLTGIQCNIVIDLTRTLLNPQVYDKFIRPTLHHDDVTNISFDLSLAQLIDVDEKNQMIRTNQWISIRWSDPKLTWNPLEWENITLLHIKYNKIWLPDIVLYNNADNLGSLNQISTNVIVSSEGLVTWLTAGIYQSSCSIDVRYFPFDEQNCSLKFASWTYDGARIDFSENSSGKDLSNLIANSEWEIIQLHMKKNVVKYSCCPETFPDLTYTIQMRRRPRFYVFNMILPCFLITIISFLGFCVPSDSGEKVSIVITTVLSMTVFLSSVTDSMPANPSSIPLICIYYLSAMIIVSIAAGMSAVSLHIYNYGTYHTYPVPIWMGRIFFCFVSKFLCMNIDIPIRWQQRQISTISTNSNNRNIINNMDVLNEVSNDIDQINTNNHNKLSVNPIDYSIKENEQESNKIIEQEWQILGRIIDRLLFFVFLFITICVFGFIFLQVPLLKL